MASTFTDLGIEKMATGENAGTWGDKTNTNLEIVEKAIAGYVEKAITSGGTTQLTITDGDSTESTSVARHAVIKLTGTITGNSIVTVPDSIEKVYIVTNGTSGAYTVQFKTASGTGITFGVSEKTTRLVYSDGTNLVDAGFGGSLDLEGRELVLDADGDTTLTADTDDQIDIKIAGADDFQFTANTFTAQSGSSIVVPDGGLTFGSTAITSTAAELNLLDGVSGLVQADLTKLAAVDSTAAELNIVDGGTSATSTTVADADRVVLNDNGTMVQVAVTDLAAYFDDEITAMPNLTSVGTLTTLTVDSIIINGANIGHTSDADALAIDSSGNVTASQNLIVTGDLTVSGDDITMGTNTAGNLLVADGTNFNSIAAGSLSEISTVANDDVFIAVDTSGGGLKKIARSTIVAGLATSGAISNVVEDTSPQLGGNLDTNSQNILIDDAHFIADENGNEQIIFQTTSSAVNQFDITNAATGGAPLLSATGGDSNIDLEILAKGTGHVTIKGGTNSGAIQFNCESNSHGQIVIAQPHSAAVTNTLTLPAGASSTLVSLVSEDTLTNKTLTTPIIAEIDSGADITLDATADIVLDAAGGNVEFKDAGTLQLTLDMDGTAGAQVIKLEVDTDDLIFKQYDGTTVLTLDDDTTVKVATDLTVGDDLSLISDSAVLKFGADGDTTLTHTDGTGLTLNSTNKLCFNDATQFIQGASGTVLDIAATDEIELTATLIDVVGNLAGSGTATFGGILKTDDATEATSTTDGSLQTDGGLSVAKDGIFGDDVTLLSDAAVLKFGADAEVTLTHVHNDGLLLNADNQLQFRDSAINIRSDADGDLDINADDEVEINSTLIDINGNVEMSGTLAQAGIATFAVAANVTQTAITSSSNAVAWDASAKPNAVHVTTENTTFSAPSNAVEGAFICLEINYNGSHTIAFNTVFEFAASTAPTTTDTDGKTDILVFRYNGAVWQEVGRTLNLSES